MLVYIVIAEYSYEASDNVAIYDNATDAEATAERLRTATHDGWGPDEVYVKSYAINSIDWSTCASDGLK